MSSYFRSKVQIFAEIFPSSYRLSKLEIQLNYGKESNLAVYFKAGGIRMLTFKKIVAAIFMVLSVIAVIAMIVALFGSWVVKARLETQVTALLLAGENVVEVTRTGLARVDSVLETSTGVVEDVDTRIKEIGAGIKEGDLLLTNLLDTIDFDLKNSIETAVTTFNQIEANIVAINDALDAIAEIPMLKLENQMTSLSKLQEVEQQMERLRENVNLLVQTIRDGRAEIIDGKISRVTDVTGGLQESLQTTRANLSDAEVRLAESGQAMANLRQRLPALLLTITIVLNIFFLLSALAFISLFLHSWEYFKCTEDGLSGLMPGDCEKSPAAA